MQELQNGQLEIISSKTKLLEKAISSSGETPFLEEQYCLNSLLKTRQRTFRISGFNLTCFTTALATACLPILRNNIFQEKDVFFRFGHSNICSSTVPQGQLFHTGRLQFRVHDIVNI